MVPCIFKSAMVISVGFVLMSHKCELEVQKLVTLIAYHERVRFYVECAAHCLVRGSVDTTVALVVRMLSSAYTRICIR